MLEFLGDAVLGLVTTEALFHRFPKFQEGHLSKLRAHLVGQRHLLRVAEQLQIGHYMLLGRGEEKAAAATRPACWWMRWKRFGGAVSGWRVGGGAGLYPARDCGAGTGAHETGDQRHPRDGFQIRLARGSAGARRIATGVCAGQRGSPEHKKTFTVEVRLPEPAMGFVVRAQGATKKRAEQEAARQALDHLATLPGSAAGP